MQIPFAFDVKKLNDFVNGDLGIADAIHKAQFSPVSSSITEPADKKTFAGLQEPNKKSGVHATEKTFISSALETQKPYIEIIKTCLELMGEVEMTLAMLTGGPNPKGIDGSFINGFSANKTEMAKMKTGYEPNAKQAAEDGPVPSEIYLGKYRRNAPTGDASPTVAEPGGLFSHPDGDSWPQYQSYEEYYDEQVNQILIPKIQSLDAETYKLAFDGRTESIGEEWGEMSEEAQLRKLSENALAPSNIKKYFRPLETTYQGKTAFIDVEDMYDINYSREIFNPENPESYYEIHTVTAKLKPGADGSAGVYPKSFTPSPARAARNFARKVLDIIINKYIPVLISLQKVIKSPVEFVGEIFMTKLKEHFEMFDPALKNKDEFDPQRSKYWSGDKFVMDGMTQLDVGLLKISVGLVGAVPSFKVGKDTLPEGNKENPLIKTALNLVAMPINFLKGVFDIFKGLLSSLFKLKELPTAIPEFLTFKAFKDLLGLPKLLEFLGAKDGDIKTIPMLNIPKEGNLDMVPKLISAFLKFIIQFINGFIGIPNTIMNLELVPKLPVPE